jgi:hypothetical protein
MVNHLRSDYRIIRGKVKEAMMEKEQLNKLLEAIEGIGYKLVSLNSCSSKVTLEISPPVFVNSAGKQVNPDTGEPNSCSRKDLERFNNFWAMVGVPREESNSEKTRKLLLRTQAMLRQQLMEEEEFEKNAGL